MGEYRYSGRIQALEILCMRLKSRAGVYPTVTFWDVQYTQLYPRHAGLKILSVWEAPPEALSGPVLSGCLERCRRESGQTAWEGLIQTGARLYLHRMSDGKTRLVAAWRCAGSSRGNSAIGKTATPIGTLIFTITWRLWIRRSFDPWERTNGRRLQTPGRWLSSKISTGHEEDA